MRPKCEPKCEALTGRMAGKPASRGGGSVGGEEEEEALRCGNYIADPVHPPPIPEAPEVPCVKRVVDVLASWRVNAAHDEAAQVTATAAGGVWGDLCGGGECGRERVCGTESVSVCGCQQ